MCNLDEIWKDLADLTQEELEWRSKLFSGNIDDPMPLVDEDGNSLFSHGTVLEWTFEDQL